MSPLGISVGERGVVTDGYALLHGHPRFRAEVQPRYEAQMRGFPRSFATAEEQIALDFQSDWSTALGSNANAIGDGGRWPIAGGGGSLVVVNVLSEGLAEAPFANALRVEQWPVGPGGSQTIAIQNGWPAIAVGESIFRRIYWWNAVDQVIPSAGDNHPVQSCFMGGSLCGDCWLKHSNSGGAGWRYRITTNDTSFPNNHASAVSNSLTTMAYHKWYRMEWEMRRIATSVWNLHAWVYEVLNGGVAKGGTEPLLYQDSDFVNSDTSNTLADLPAKNVNDPASQRHMLISWQGGVAQETVGAGLYNYFGGCAVSKTGQIGPYQIGEAA